MMLKTQKQRKVYFNYSVATVIKKKYDTTEFTKNLTTLKTLVDYTENPESWRNCRLEKNADRKVVKVWKINQESALDTKLFKVQGYIFDYAPKNLNDCLKKYCRACNHMFF